MSGVVRTLFCLLLIVSVCTLVSCGEKSEADKPETETSVEEIETPAKPTAIKPINEETDSVKEVKATKMTREDEPTDTITTPSGLKYIDIKVGEGDSPKQGQTVEAHYTLWRTDGTKLQSSKDRGMPFKFPLGKGAVIPGWDEGVATMKPGGIRKMIIPPELAYGERGRPPMIPGNTTLVFEIELLGVQ